MKRIHMLTGLLAVGVVLAGAALTAQAGDDKFDLSKFMKSSHGKKGLRAQMSTALKDKDWDDAAKIAKRWFTEAQKFTKATPPKGSKEDFTKKANTYCKTVKTLTEAIEKKDSARANGAMGQIGKSCKACHDNHK